MLIIIQGLVERSRIPVEESGVMKGASMFLMITALAAIGLEGFLLFSSNFTYFILG